MTEMVLTKKMLEIIEQGIDDRMIIINDDLSFDNIPNKKELKENWETCNKVNDWIYAIRQKRGYND